MPSRYRPRNVDNPASARLTDGDRHTIIGRVNSIYERYKHFRPFPVPVDDGSLKDLLRFSWSDDLRNSVEFLEKDADASHFLDTSSYGGFTVAANIDSETQKMIRVQVKFDKPAVVFDPWNMARNPDDWRYELSKEYPAYNKIVEWVVQQDSLKEKVKKAQRYSDSVLWSCTTTGQIKRVWPELVNYFPSEYNQRLMKAERKSRIPKTLELDVDRQEEATVLLASLSLLEDTKHHKITLWS